MSSIEGPAAIAGAGSLLAPTVCLRNDVGSRISSRLVQTGRPGSLEKREPEGHGLLRAFCSQSHGPRHDGHCAHATGSEHGGCEGRRKWRSAMIACAQPARPQGHTVRVCRDPLIPFGVIPQAGQERAAHGCKIPIRKAFQIVEMRREHRRSNPDAPAGMQLRSGTAAASQTGPEDQNDPDAGRAWEGK